MISILAGDFVEILCVFILLGGFQFILSLFRGQYPNIHLSSLTISADFIPILSNMLILNKNLAGDCGLKPHVPRRHKILLRSG